jgi:hypothetical protein
LKSRENLIGKYKVNMNITKYSLDFKIWQQNLDLSRVTNELSKTHRIIYRNLVFLILINSLAMKTAFSTLKHIIG